MSSAFSCLYRGEVVHRRLAPLRHELRYRVYNFFADIDELSLLAKRHRFFSYNRFNLFSISDRNHGRGDGTSIREHVWSIVEKVNTDAPVTRVFMFCYPRVLGFVFNPVTVFYGFDADNELRLMIYEVNNTFGGRHSYAIPVDGELHQSCGKRLYVSPFNTDAGHYDFILRLPAEELKLCITLSTVEGSCLKAWFSGTRIPLTDGNLWRSFISLPLLPLKVIGGIHWEAVRLWLKGLRFTPRPPPPLEPVSVSRHSRDKT